jgi:hypothetical protein
MTHPFVSERRAKALSSALFLFALAIVSFMNSWWPDLMLAIGIPFAMRQALLGRFYDMTISLVLFLGVFFTAQFDVSWEVLLPVVFTVGALYVLAREFFESKMQEEAEAEENANHEIEEETEIAQKE